MTCFLGSRDPLQEQTRMKTASKDDLEDLNISHAVLQSEAGSVLCQDSFDMLSEGLGVVGLVEQ